MVVHLSKVYARELVIDVPGFAYFKAFEKDFDGTREADLQPHYSGALVSMNKSSNLRWLSKIYEFADAQPGKDKVITGSLRLTGFNGDATTGVPLRGYGQASIRSPRLPEGATTGNVTPPVIVVGEERTAPVVRLPIEPEGPIEPERAIEPEVTLEPTPPIAPAIPVVSIGPTTPSVPSTPSEPATPTEPRTPDVPADLTLPSTPIHPETPMRPALSVKPETPTLPAMSFKPDMPMGPEMPVQPETPARAKLPLVPKKRPEAALAPLAARRAVACEERRGAPVTAPCDRTSVPVPSPAASAAVSGGIRLPGDVPAVRLGR
jgi:hypothetical protein